jgi:hypothetical protein
VEQSNSSAAQSPRKSRKKPWRHFDPDDTEAPEQSPKKQKTKATEPKPTKPKAEAVSGGKVTLRKSLGISKDEARKLAKHHMSMATKLMEDSDEE